MIEASWSTGSPKRSSSTVPWARQQQLDRWQVDETYVKVAGQWRCVYRAIDQTGQVIDVFVAWQRDANAARRFFQQAIGAAKVAPAEVTTDKAPVYPGVLEELLEAAWHRSGRDENNRVEADHGGLKARLRPMRGKRPRVREPSDQLTRLVQQCPSAWKVAATPTHGCEQQQRERVLHQHAVDLEELQGWSPA